jgi:hypothetical protein
MTQLSDQNQDRLEADNRKLLLALVAEVGLLRNEVATLQQRLDGLTSTRSPSTKTAAIPKPEPYIQRPLSYWVANVPVYDEAIDNGEAERYLNRKRISPEEVTLTTEELKRQPRAAHWYGNPRPTDIIKMAFWRFVALLFLVSFIVLLGLMLISLGSRL